MVLAGWFRAFVAIAHGGRDYLARKGAQPRSWIAVPARLARLGLRPQGMDRTCRCRTRRGSQVQPRRSLFKHRPLAGPWTLQRIGAEGPRVVRSRPRRSAQGRDAGGVTSAPWASGLDLIRHGSHPGEVLRLRLKPPIPFGQYDASLRAAGPEMHCRAQPRGVIQVCQHGRELRLSLPGRATSRSRSRYRYPGQTGDSAPTVGFALERARLGPCELEGGGRYYQRH